MIKPMPIASSITVININNKEPFVAWLSLASVKVLMLSMPSELIVRLVLESVFLLLVKAGTHYAVLADIFYFERQLANSC